MPKSHTTIDHKKIQRWAEERGGKPATVKRTKTGDEPGILRLDFEPRDENLEPIDWGDFFEKFEGGSCIPLSRPDRGGRTEPVS